MTEDSSEREIDDLTESIGVWGRRIWEFARAFAQQLEVTEVAVGVVPRPNYPPVILVLNAEGAVVWRTARWFRGTEDRVIVWPDGTLARTDDEEVRGLP